MPRPVVSYRNSTSNHNIMVIRSGVFFVVSYRNSTSNHNLSSAALRSFTVVSYRNSTSNHNKLPIIMIIDGVVSYRNSTSNHNSGSSASSPIALYLIEILHQTTTLRLRLSLFQRCILSKFYIKPQRNRQTW